MTFTDTHCHLADPKLADTLPAVLAEAQAAGVARFIVPATSPKDCTPLRSWKGRLKTSISLWAFIRGFQTASTKRHSKS